MRAAVDLVVRSRDARNPMPPLGRLWWLARTEPICADEVHSFVMTILDHPREVSVTDATQRGVAGIISDAERGDIVVTRRSRPVAAIVSMERLEQIQGMLDDLRDLTLAAARVLTDDGPRISFDDLLAAYGYSREDLAAIPDEPRSGPPEAHG